MLRVEDLQDEGLPGHDQGTVRVLDGGKVVKAWDYFDWAQKGASIICAREFIAGRCAIEQEAR